MTLCSFAVHTSQMCIWITHALHVCVSVCLVRVHLHHVQLAQVRLIHHVCLAAGMYLLLVVSLQSGKCIS